MFFKKKTESPEAMLKKAEEYKEKGVAYAKAKQYDKAEKEYLKCVSALETLSKQLPYESETVQRMLSQIYGLLSLLGLGEDRIKTKGAEAAAWAKKEVEINEKIVKKNSTAEALDFLAMSYGHLGTATADIILCDKALKIWMELQKKFPNEPVYAEKVKSQQAYNKRLISSFF